MAKKKPNVLSMNEKLRLKAEGKPIPADPKPEPKPPPPPEPPKTPQQIFQENLLKAASNDPIFAKWLQHWIEWRTVLARDNQVCKLPDFPEKVGQIWMAGRGYGKTRIGAEETVAFAMLNPNSYQRVICPTFQDMRDTAFEGESGIMGCVPREAVKWNRSMGEIEFYNGSTIKGYSAEQPDRLRGSQSQRDWYDELAAWGSTAGENHAKLQRETWNMAMLGLRLKPRPTFIATTTPRSTPLLRELMARKDIIITRGSTYDNLDNLGKNFESEILRYEGTSLGRQEIYGEMIDLDEGGILKRDWFRLWPSDQAFPVFEFVVISYDTAFTEKTSGDFSACTIWGVWRDKLQGNANVMLVDCWRARLAYPDLRKKVLKDWVAFYGAGQQEQEKHFSYTRQQVQGRQPDVMLIEEKGSGQSLIQDMRHEGVNCWAYNPGRADKHERVHRISPLVAAGRVWIPESGLEKGKPKKWAEDALMEWTSFPDGVEHDDYCLAGETLISMADETSKRIDQIQIGDLVATPNGPRRVTSSGCTGIRPVYRLTHTKGHLIGTGSHPIWSNGSYCRLDTLRQNDNLFFKEERNTSWKNRQQKARKPSFLTVVGITAIRTQQKKFTDAISCAMADYCIEKYINLIMEKSKKGMTYITLTITHLIMTYQTCDPSLAENIRDYTPKFTKKPALLMPFSAIWTVFAHSQKHGMPPRKERHGIVKTQELPFLNLLFQQKAFAFNAAKNLWLKGIGASNFALITALKNSESAIRTTIAALATNTKTVWHAGLSFLLKNTAQPVAVEVVALKQEKCARPVFNITVEEESCYFANGILTHNCDTLSQTLSLLNDNRWLELPKRPLDRIEEIEADERPDSAYANPYA